MSRILVVDDDLATREMLALALVKTGHRVDRAEGLGAARRALREGRPDLVVCDIYLGDGSGLDLLRSTRELPAPPPVILMTARGSVETAASALGEGVFDYLAKPFDLDAMLERVDAALAGQAESAPEPAAGPASMIVGCHPGIVEVYKAVGRVAPMRVPVLVLGETGTGKELVAQALHRHGAHPCGPFVPVHCGAIPDALVESELFGHRRGAFTDARADRRGALAQADGGTVFLDEVGEISPAFQVKLLRFLEDGMVRPLGAESAEPVAVRVVAATHRDLRALVAAGSFRQDLYYRLAGYEITIPPLRGRLSDLPDLVGHFQRQFRDELGLPGVAPASPAVLAALAGHAWPGNVRELGHVVRRVLIETGALDDPAAVRRALDPPGLPAPGQAPCPPPFRPPFRTLEALERDYVLAVLAASGGNKTEAARILGIERKTLARKLQPAAAGNPDPFAGGEP